MKTLRIAIADDHPVVSKGISFLIKKDPSWELMFVAQSKNELLEQLKNHLVDMLILDVVMPDVSSTDLFSEILQAYPNLRIIAYTSLNSPILIKMLFKEGVKGYVNKNDPLEELADAIRAIGNDGGIYIAEQYKHLIAKKYDSDTEPGISKREREVLTLIAQQLTTAEIAEKLFISANTVESHRKKLFEKFQVSNMTGLITEAIRQGYIH
ncbi:MAG: DNA-binding response regulator [Bacteroidetes bacterium]|nr:DNA-binding response regulator [Bacteroidota bacterium]